MTERRDEYYSRDEEGRFETHETEAAARRDAEEILGNCQEEASDNGWPEGTGDVEWGRLVPLGECVASNERESDRSDFDYLIDYNIKDLPDPIEALRSALESVTRERDEAVRRVGELEVECRTLHDKLDGPSHRVIDVQKSDRRKTRFLRSIGWHVFRVTNDMVDNYFEHTVRYLQDRIRRL